MILIPIDSLSLDAKSSKLFGNGSLIKVDIHNASTYLDSGTFTENCECTCKS